MMITHDIVQMSQTNQSCDARYAGLQRSCTWHVNNAAEERCSCDVLQRLTDT